MSRRKRVDYSERLQELGDHASKARPQDVVVAERSPPQPPAKPTLASRIEMLERQVLDIQHPPQTPVGCAEGEERLECSSCATLAGVRDTRTGEVRLKTRDTHARFVPIEGTVIIACRRCGKMIKA